MRLAGGRDMNAPKENSNGPGLIAPCGVNCRVCRAYMREQDPCPGCRAGSIFKSEVYADCALHCGRLASGECKYCFECEEFPCEQLIDMDRHYRIRSAASPIANLNLIKEHGIWKLIKSEKRKWTCPECGAILCMQEPQCASCGHLWHQ